MHEHEENWRSYPIESEDTMGFSMTDLGWADPPGDHPWCLRLAVELADPGAEGLGGSEEMEALSEGEDVFLAGAEASDVIHVARVRLGGEVAWFLYARSEDALETLGAAAAEAMQRDVSVGSQHDPEWGIYESLLPSPAVERWMLDCDVVDSLEEQGDALTTAREVRHYAYFEDRATAESYALSGEEEGFEAEVTEPSAEQEAFTVQLIHQSAVDLDTISQTTQSLAERAEELDGEYDGWECKLVKGSGGTVN